MLVAFFCESVAEIICTSRNHVVAVIAIGRQWNYSMKLTNTVHQYKINDTISHHFEYNLHRNCVTTCLLYTSDAADE